MSDWLVVANPHVLRIYDMKSRKNIRLSREIHHADAWFKGESSNSNNFAFNSLIGKHADNTVHSSAIETERFAKRIADLIEHGRVLGMFENWHFFATPELHRAIKQHLSVASIILIKQSATNDFTHLKPEELLNIVYPEYETIDT